MFVKKEQLFIDFSSIAWEYPAEGIRRKVMAYGDQLMAVYVEFKKGAIGAMHSHPHLQITYIQSGSFDVQIDGNKERQKGGDFYYIPANAVHGVVALEDSILIDFFTPMREDFIPKEVKAMEAVGA
ncbi:MAG: cupin domain-containing protein [Bacteroidetes bacterium]|nr:cupin domain-containing protein [Bacteroidota bacterium]